MIFLDLVLYLKMVTFLPFFEFLAVNILGDKLSTGELSYIKNQENPFFELSSSAPFLQI